MAKILVIDDCPEFREVIRDTLEDLGHSVILAGSADEGKEKCQQGVDLVLCDLVMPVDSDDELDDVYMDESAMAGVHAIHEIHRLRPEVPVVAISGQMHGQPLRAIQNFGAVGSLAKPFAREDLQRVIDTALRRAEVMRA
jgi:CheY-like chemotaxis protein